MQRNWFAPPMAGEVSFKDIVAKSENGDFHEWNFEPFDFVEYGYEDVLDKLKNYTAVEYLGYQEKRDAAKKAGNDEEAVKWQAEMDRMVDEVYAIYRKKNVYPTAYFSEMGIMQEIERCISYKAFWDGDVVSCGAGVGTTLCKFLFPNLQDTPSKHDLEKVGAESIFAKFHNEAYLKRAIRFCFSYKNGCPVPTAVEGGLRLVGSAPSNFRPMNAKAIYERFCPEGGTIFDPCCVDDETEYFNGHEWKSIAKYTDGEKVLQYNEDGSAELVTPNEYIHYKSNAPFYEYTGRSFNSCLTGNHTIVYRKRVNQSAKLSSNIYRISQEEILNKDFRGRIPLTCNINGEVSIDEIKLRLLIALQADGSIDNRSTGRIRFMFTKEHKINRMTELLDKYGIDYSTAPAIGVGKKDGVYFYLNSVELASYFDEDKSFPKSWYNLSDHCRKIFIDEIFKWDGTVLKDTLSSFHGHELIRGQLRQYSSTNKNNAELVYFILNSTEGSMGASLCVDIRDGLKPCYKVSAREAHNYSEYNYKRGYSIVNKEDKYCFNVPSHMLVLRRKNQMFVTGNCGFGGRMLGALSSKKNFRYVGCDPNTETMYHLHQLGDYIESVTDRENSYELHCVGSEDFHGPANSVDFMFTSPPYFDLEVYSDEPTQCYNKFPELDQWLEGYVRATIKNIAHMLKPGRVYAINIADFTCGSTLVKYVDEWIRISTEEGMPLYDTVYLGVTARAGSKEQAAGELKKENILIFKKPL